MPTIQIQMESISSSGMQNSSINALNGENRVPSFERNIYAYMSMVYFTQALETALEIVFLLNRIPIMPKFMRKSNEYI